MAMFGYRSLAVCDQVVCCLHSVSTCTVIMSRDRT